MGIKAENIFAFLSGVHPDALAINSTGAATQDGTEFIAEYLNNFVLGPWQALFDYASITPNGVSEAAGASQWLASIEKGFAVGPGKLVGWFIDDTPAVSGDRVLLLQGQGVLISTYGPLDAKVYVGNAANAAVAAGGGAFYRSSDSGGAVPDIAGPYLQLPEGRGYTLRGLDLAASVDPDGASRFLGDNQVDAMQGHIHPLNMGAIGANATTNDVTFYPASIDTVGNMLWRTGTNVVNNRMITSTTSDGVNGTPRINSETRMSNMSIHIGIGY
jgi:hypothetical protein